MFALGLFALVTTAHAQSIPTEKPAYGGVGITVGALDPGWGPETVDSLSLCLGVTGYRTQARRRYGAEGHYCGTRGTTLVNGGVQAGFQGQNPTFHAFLHGGAGAGYIRLKDPRTGDAFRGVYGYARGSVGLGGRVGDGMVLEAAGYAELPINLVGVADGIEPRYTFPHVGVKVSLLFGSFNPASQDDAPVRDERQAPVRPDQLPERPATPGRPRTPSSPPPAQDGPLRPGDLPPAQTEDDEEPPLALPG